MIANLLQHQSPVPSQTGTVVLRTHELTKQYGERVAVKDLNLEVRQGEIFSFLGPNGVGKTTTIRMLLGLITPTAGSAAIFGQEVQAHRAEVLPRVGALIETPALHLGLSGRENLRVVGALTNVSETRIDALLEVVDLAARQRDRVRTYSLGMKQRLGLAVALLNDPDLVILDEPANGLDPAGIVEMRDLLRHLVTQGKTIFISSHVLTEIQQICTRVAIIAEGRLVTEAAVEELTQGSGEFTVRIDRAGEALTLIQQQPWGSTARLLDAHHLLTPAPDHQGNQLTRFFFAHGFFPDELSQRTDSLEEVFLRLTTPQGGTQA